MAFKRSWAHVKRAPEPTTFQGKYSLKRTAGMDRVGTECFVIPLDMAAGYSCLPYHSLKKNGDEGFHGSTFNSSKIACKRFDPETGELRKELPLCCKLAQLEVFCQVFYNIFLILQISITKVRENHVKHAKNTISLAGELTCFYKDLSCRE